MKTLEDLFLDELAGSYDSECRIAITLPHLEKAATCVKLKKALQSHLSETASHLQKLERVFQYFNLKARGTTCETMAGLLKEGARIVIEFKGSPAINAALILVLQKVEHFEIVSYGCLQEWAELLGNKRASDLLGQILQEERAANEALNELAHASINREALGRAGQKGAPDGQDAKLRFERRTLRPLRFLRVNSDLM